MYLLTKWLLEEESGQGMTEYVFLILLVAILLISIITDFGSILLDKYQDMSNKI